MSRTLKNNWSFQTTTHVSNVFSAAYCLLLIFQVVEMVKNRLSQEDAQQTGWLLDGYPRSADQAEAIEEAGIRPDVFILIDVG